MKRKKHQRPKLHPIIHLNENDRDYRLVRENKFSGKFKPNDQGEYMFDEVGIFFN